jgi:hypothetical protein
MGCFVAAHLTGTLFARMLHAYKSAQPPAASAAVSAFATPRAMEPVRVLELLR